MLKEKGGGGENPPPFLPTHSPLDSCIPSVYFRFGDIFLGLEELDELKTQYLVLMEAVNQHDVEDCFVRSHTILNGCTNGTKVLPLSIDMAEELAVYQHTSHC